MIEGGTHDYPRQRCARLLTESSTGVSSSVSWKSVRKVMLLPTAAQPWYRRVPEEIVTAGVPATMRTNREVK